MFCIVSDIIVNRKHMMPYDLLCVFLFILLRLCSFSFFLSLNGFYKVEMLFGLCSKYHVPVVWKGKEGSDHLAMKLIGEMTQQVFFFL